MSQKSTLGFNIAFIKELEYSAGFIITLRASTICVLMQQTGVVVKEEAKCSKDKTILV